MSFFIFSKHFIKSMARPWNEMKQSLRGHLYPMLEHLVKVYYYHDYSQYMNGWIATVRKGFEDVGKCSHNKKYPKKEAMYDFIVNEWADGDVTNMHNTVVDDLNNFYNEVTKIIDPYSKGFDKFFKAYVNHLSDIISQKGTISMVEVRDFFNDYFGGNDEH